MHAQSMALFFFLGAWPVDGAFSAAKNGKAKSLKADIGMENYEK